MAKKTKPLEIMSLEDWLTEVVATIASSAQLLEQTHRVTTRRDDIGITLTVYFNYGHILKVDIVRQDKQPFFSLPLPVNQELREKMMKGNQS